MSLLKHRVDHVTSEHIIDVGVCIQLPSHMHVYSMHAPSHS